MGVRQWLGRRLGLTDGAFWAHWHGVEAASGKTVTVDSALQLSTAWACVRLISETVATLPLGVYRRDDAGRKEPAAGTALYGVLHDQPNADQSACEFWEGVVACLCLWGNAYAEKTTSAGQVRSLAFLRPELMEVDRDEAGALRYRYHDPEAGVRTLAEDEVFHVRGFGVGGDLGLSPIRYARQSLGAAMAADEAAAKMLANGVRPSGVLEMDGTLTPDQRAQLRANVVEPLAGSRNAGGVFTLEAGLKFKPITMNPEDAQLLETRSFAVEDICRWFRVPPFMVGHTEKSTSWGTGLEQQNIGFLTYALRPYLTRIEQAIKRQLIPRVQRGTLFAEFNLEGLLRADSQGRAALYSQAAQNGWMTRNEIRSKDNLPPLPGGDQLTVQSNLVPLDRLGEALPAPGDTP